MNINNRYSLKIVNNFAIHGRQNLQITQLHKTMHFITRNKNTKMHRDSRTTAVAQ